MGLPGVGVPSGGALILRAGMNVSLVGVAMHLFGCDSRVVEVDPEGAK